MNGWMDGRTDGWTDGWKEGRTDGWIDGRMDGRMDGWMDGWTDGRTDGPTDCVPLTTPCFDNAVETGTLIHSLGCLSSTLNSALCSDCWVHGTNKSSFSVSDRPGRSLTESDDAVLIQFDLLMMSKILLETCTCRGL